MKPSAIAFGIAAALSVVLPAHAGHNHARCIVNFQTANSLVADPGPADAVVSKKNKYCHAHEEPGVNYIVGNAGWGHAHHHSNAMTQAGTGEAQDDPDLSTDDPNLPDPLLNLQQTWTPDGNGNIVVAWSGDSYLKLDTSQLTGNKMTTTTAKLEGARLNGLIELTAWKDEGGAVHSVIHREGVFVNVPYNLATQGALLVLTFPNPPNWTVPGQQDSFDIAIEGGFTKAKHTN